MPKSIWKLHVLFFFSSEVYHLRKFKGNYPNFSHLDLKWIMIKERRLGGATKAILMFGTLNCVLPKVTVAQSRSLKHFLDTSKKYCPVDNLLFRDCYCLTDKLKCDGLNITVIHSLFLSSTGWFNRNVSSKELRSIWNLPLYLQMTRPPKLILI